MPQTQLNERKGTSGNPFDTIERYQPKKSAFDLSFILQSTIDLGELKVIDCLECVPNSHHRLNLTYMLNSFPLEVAPFTNYKVRTHFYWCPYECLWEGNETFITKGRNEDIVISKPSLDTSKIASPYEDDITLVASCFSSSGFGEPWKYYLDSPSSLLADFALASSHWNGSSSPKNYLPFSNAETGQSNYPLMDIPNRHLPQSRISALQFFAYQKIYHDNFISPNLMQNNKVWFPDNISAEAWRIDFRGNNLTSDGHFVPIGHDLPDVDNDESYISNFVPFVGVKNPDTGVYESGDNCVNILQKRYSMFDNNRFYAAKPWLVRGNEPSLNGGKVSGEASLDFSKSNFFSLGMYDPLMPITARRDVFPSDTPFFLDQGNWSTGEVNNLAASLRNALSRGRVDTSSLSSDLHFTANNLRTLMALSIKAEIDALTNGNYNSFVRAETGANPKHEEYTPRYLGGTVDYIRFNNITQTSEGSDGSPLGTQAGLGGVTSQGHVFDFYCDDYGYIIGLMWIVPESQLIQGLEHQWFDLTQDTVFSPILNELGFEPIYNKELYVSGQLSDDDGLFGYSTRNSWMKMRNNKNTGLFGLPPSSDLMFSAYTQNRELEGTPKLSQEFVTASPLNTRRDFLKFPSLPAFRLQAALEYSSILPLPFASTPNRFGF